MSASDLVVAVVSLVVGAAISWLIQHRYFRKASPMVALYLNVSSTALIGSVARNQGLTVSHGEHILENPHLTEVTVSNTSDNDLAPAAFTGRDLILYLENIAALYGLQYAETDITQPSPSTRVLPPTASQLGTSLSISPEILKARSAWKWTMITDGKPATPQWKSNYLVNVTTQSDRDRIAFRAREDKRGFIPGIVLSVGLAILGFGTPIAVLVARLETPNLKWRLGTVLSFVLVFAIFWALTFFMAFIARAQIQGYQKLASLARVPKRATTKPRS